MLFFFVGIFFKRIFIYLFIHHLFLLTLQVRAVSAVSLGTNTLGQLGAPILPNQTKYFDLLARYYVMKRQHLLAAHILLRLAERRSTDAGDVPTLDQR